MSINADFDTVLDRIIAGHDTDAIKTCEGFGHYLSVWHFSV